MLCVDCYTGWWIRRCPREGNWSLPWSHQSLSMYVCPQPSAPPSPLPTPRPPSAPHPKNPPSNTTLHPGSSSGSLMIVQLDPLQKQLLDIDICESFTSDYLQIWMFFLQNWCLISKNARVGDFASSSHHWIAPHRVDCTVTVCVWQFN